MKEQRKFKRYSVRLKVHNRINDKLIGYIEDISIHGMSIKSIDPLPDMQEMNVWFGANKGENEQKIELKVIKVWDAFSDTIPRFYNTGLHFINPTEGALDLLQDLIVDLKDECVSKWEESSFV